MLVSVTRLHLRRWWFLPLFAVHALRSTRQAQGSAGFLGGRLSPEPLLGFWTITASSDEQAMRQFRNTAAHLKAMPGLLDWCDEASYVRWHQDDFSVPNSATAFERMRDGGKLSKVRYPSAAHASGKTAPHGEPNAGQILSPRGS